VDVKPDGHCFNFASHRIPFFQIFSENARGQAVIGIVCSFEQRGGFEVQINVIDRDTLLKARENPELYKDIVVRVWLKRLFCTSVPVHAGGDHSPHTAYTLSVRRFIMDKKYSAPAVSRLLNIIELMASENCGFSINELARELGYPINTVYRICMEMQEHGYLEKDAKTGFIILADGFLLLARLRAAASSCVHVRLRIFKSCGMNLMKRFISPCCVKTAWYYWTRWRQRRQFVFMWKQARCSTRTLRHEVNACLLIAISGLLINI
jgi:hypothetical protein